jgi:hypothetical protein
MDYQTVLLGMRKRLEETTAELAAIRDSLPEDQRGRVDRSLQILQECLEEDLGP